MKEQSIKDALGTGVKFHEDLPRVDKKELIGEYVFLRDGKVIDDWDGEWGTTEFALLMFERGDGQAVTTLCGGKAVVRQVRRLLKYNKLPGRWRCFLNVVTGENGDYYLLDYAEPTNEKQAYAIDAPATVPADDDPAKELGF